MKVIYEIENLCCAHCASIIESKIKNLDGILDCTVNFLTQRITIDTQNTDDLFSLIEKTVKNVEPDCILKK